MKRKSAFLPAILFLFLLLGLGALFFFLSRNTGKETELARAISDYQEGDGIWAPDERLSVPEDSGEAFFLNGIQAFSMGDYETARTWLLRAKETPCQDPSLPAYLYYYINQCDYFLTGSGNTETVSLALEAIRNYPPLGNNTSMLWDLMNSITLSEDYETTILSLLQQHLDLSTNLDLAAWAWMETYLAMMEYQNKEYAKSIRRLYDVQLALEGQSLTPALKQELLYAKEYIANIYVIFQDYENAVAIYQDLIDRTADQKPYSSYVACINMASAYLELSDTANARRAIHLLDAHLQDLDMNIIEEVRASMNDVLANIAMAEGDYAMADHFLKLAENFYSPVSYSGYYPLYDPLPESAESLSFADSADLHPEETVDSGMASDTEDAGADAITDTEELIHTDGAANTDLTLAEEALSAADSFPNLASETDNPNSAFIGGQYFIHLTRCKYLYHTGFGSLAIPVLERMLSSGAATYCGIEKDVYELLADIYQDTGQSEDLIRTYQHLVVLDEEFVRTIQREYLEFSSYYQENNQLKQTNFQLSRTNSIAIVIILLFSLILLSFLWFIHILKHKNITDALTGVYNRQKLSQLTKAWHWGGPPDNLGVVLMDIDFFKYYNDTYGHPAGDAALKEVAALLMSCIRQKDIVIRYGGEEFLLLLQDVSEDSATAICQRVRSVIQTRAIPHAASEVADYITLSMGLCYQSDSSHHSLAELINIADQCLYQSKTEGRDRLTTQTFS